jgi:hypothetical protein
MRCDKDLLKLVFLSLLSKSEVKSQGAVRPCLDAQLWTSKVGILPL